ncbi:hypothetical protein MKQ68_19630 [Chitinophaga horti]|uniref:ATPase AAA-type core domain-containing protein n=1 Tax=Chitinophaga horti TaxID=2920382 RepID=A0ABY6JCQ4_9BACT|nr:AAA family ATPase [Chitinophaga horti]UYQ95994.1 hypothetical protein MKQ68_19630 [Chitinophaga horti]
MHDPEVLVLDEPTSGLDPNQLAEIRQLIKDVGQNKTVMLSTHIMQEVEAMCSRVIIINKGNIIADDSITNLQQMGQGFVEVSFGEIATKEELESLGQVNRALARDNNTWQLYSDDLEAVRKNLLQFALINNRNILSLRSNSQSLEDIFREKTQK